MKIQVLDEKDVLVQRFPALKGATFCEWTPEEAAAYWAKRRAAAKPDNAEFAARVQAQIEEEVARLVPQVVEAVIKAHAAFQFDEIAVELQLVPLPDAALFEKYRHAYREYDIFRNNRHHLEHRPGGIEHPSITVPESMRDTLVERSFHWSTFGWFDACGSAIKSSCWLSYETSSADFVEPFTVTWIDPAGIRDIYREFDELHEKLKVIGQKSELVFKSATRRGKQAFKRKVDKTCNPFSKNSILWLGWNSGFQQAFHDSLPVEEPEW